MHGQGTTTVEGKEFVDNWIKELKNKLANSTCTVDF